MWTQQERESGRGQETATRRKWTTTALLLCLHLGCVIFFVSMAYISVKIKNYTRLVKNEIEVAKDAEDTVHASLVQLTSQLELNSQMQRALIQNLMSQAEVMFSDLEIISQEREGSRDSNEPEDNVLSSAHVNKKRTRITYAAEHARRRTENIVRELWNFVYDQLAVLDGMLTMNEQSTTSFHSPMQTDSQGITTISNLTAQYAENTLIVSDKNNTSPTAAVDLTHKVEGENTVEVNCTSGKKAQHTISTTSISSNIQRRLHLFKQELDGYRRALLDSFDLLKKADNAENIRLQMSKKLGNLVQHRLYHLQNPTDCHPSRMTGCSGKACGFGCNFHHFVYCLIDAYATNKTLIIYPTAAWEPLFKLPSETCIHSRRFSHVHNTNMKHKTQRANNSESGGSDSLSSNEDDDVRVHMLPLIEDLIPEHHSHLPLNVPRDLAAILEIFHGNPAAWWVGQIAAYLFRPTTFFLDHLQSIQRKLGYKKPIVGVHVRRTDKVSSEAEWHSLEEYMVHVEDYYDQLQRSMPHVTRRVFLATDDSLLLGEARKAYPNYTFVSDNNASKINVESRDLPDSVRGVATDIYLLSQSDFLVCTFSSQVCRLAYELMQTIHGDASQNFRSLDDIYYFGGQIDHVMTAIEPHKANSNWQDSIDLEKGDSILVAGNHWNGFSKGFNERTGISGMYPSYKVEDSIGTFPMPTYPNVG